MCLQIVLSLVGSCTYRHDLRVGLFEVMSQRNSPLGRTNRLWNIDSSLFLNSRDIAESLELG